MRIERLKEEHISDVVKIEEECFPHPWTYDEIEQSSSYPNGHFFVAIDDNERVVGYIGTYVVIDEFSVTDVAVLKEYRRQGIGNMLVAAACENAEKCDAKLITLEVRTSNATAIKIYEENGFKIDGVRRKIFRDPDEDGYVMTRRFK